MSSPTTSNPTPKEVASGSPGEDHRCHETHGPVALAWARLTIAAAQVDGAEDLRMATANRLGALERNGAPDSELILLHEQLDALLAVERMAVRDLERTMKAHPLGEWVQSVKGVGLKTAARLLGAIGDPAWNHAEERPRRGPAELWAYCGYDVRDGQAPRRRKGAKSNWNAEARKRTWLIANCAIKHRDSPYREAYDKARESWEDRDTSDGHKHNHALRMVAKAFLKDLFLQAKEETCSD